MREAQDRENRSAGLPGTDAGGAGQGRMREAEGRDAGAAESADEELQATIARWFGTLSSIVIPLTMLDSTRLRGMSNVTPTDQSAGPVHGWSISTLVRQATIGVSDRDTETIKRVAISSLTASTLPSRPSDQNDKAFDDAKQDTSTARTIWHRASKSMCPGLVFQDFSSPFDTTCLLYQPSDNFPLLKHRPTRSYIHQKLLEANLHDIDLFAPSVCASTHELQPQKEASKFTHKTKSTNNFSNLRLDEIGPGGAHEVIQIQHLMPVTDIHRIFESPQTSAS